jgi:hypothetical protein
MVRFGPFELDLDALEDLDGERVERPLDVAAVERRLDVDDARLQPAVDVRVADVGVDELVQRLQQPFDIDRLLSIIKAATTG